MAEMKAPISQSPDFAIVPCGNKGCCEECFTIENDTNLFWFNVKEMEMSQELVSFE